MIRTRGIGAAWGLGALLGALCLAPTAPGNAAPPGTAVLDQVSMVYPVTGERVTVTKLRDNATGRTFTEAKNPAGQGVDATALGIAEDKARSDRYGKVEPRLADRLNSLDETKKTKVSIWLASPEPPSDRRASLTTRLDKVRTFMEPRRKAVVDALTAMNAKPTAPQYAPAVFATLSKSQIKKISDRTDVAVVYGTVAYSLTSDDAATTERAYRVWNGGNLGAGEASRPVVHEPDGISDYNPNLNNATHPVVYYCSSVSARCPAGKNIWNSGSPSGPHASGVAGVIGSTNSWFRGVAPSAQLLISANPPDFDDQNLVDAFEWARGNGGDPTNMSWGTTCPDGNQTFMSRYVDWAVRTLYATFTISSGNTRGCPSADLQVSAPGSAWSAITVGAIEDDNSGFWSGDGMTSFSRWENPGFAPGMQKPEVVAVGEDRRTTDDVGINPNGVAGTSFSAPAVAGQVTQMLARQPGQKVWPETNKAAVLVSAFHDIVAGQEQDGVGAVVMNHSDDTYRLNRFFNDSGDATSFPKNYTINLTAGQVVQAATVWTSWSTGPTGVDTLGADIDMCVVRNDTGANVACSASLQNAWEHVQFTAPVTGGYTIRPTLFSSEPGWPGSFLGTAWSVRDLPSQCTGGTAVPAAGGTYNGQNTINGPTFFDSYPGWGFDQRGRERVYKVDLTTTKDITVTDNNANLDLHLMKFITCNGDSANTQTLVNGADSVFLNNAAPGTYWLVVDGRNGWIGSTNVTFTINGP